MNYTTKRKVIQFIYTEWLFNLSKSLDSLQNIFFHFAFIYVLQLKLFCKSHHFPSRKLINP